MIRPGIVGSGKSLPESSEQPVVHLAKETSHYAEQSRTSAVVLSRDTATRRLDMCLSGENEANRLERQVMFERGRRRDGEKWGALSHGFAS